MGARAGGSALELMAGRGYAIWGMQKNLLPPMHFEVAQIYMCIHCPFTCAYTVPKFAYWVRDKKGTQNRVGYSKKLPTDMA